MKRTLVVATSKNTRGGITAVLKLYEQSKMWHDYHCRWIGTHRDVNFVVRLIYYIFGSLEYLFFLPFYDIVHFHISLDGTVKRKYPLFKIAKLLKKKTIVHLHCGSQIDDIWSRKYQYMFEHCDCGILLSEGLKKKIEEHIGKTNKLEVVYNPCPIVTSPDHYEKKNQILFSGTLYEGKGYKDLIKAFAVIASRHPEWKLVLAGNGEMEQAYSLAKDLGISSQVVLLGWVKGEDKHRAFSESSIFCLPSYAEGFPMAVLDAWAYGLPVITTPVGGIPDVAEDGKNMLLFEPGDVDELSKKLEMLILDSNLREKIAEESVKLAKGQFSLNAVTENVGALYERLFLNQ